jgi:hypothetical protein
VISLRYPPSSLICTRLVVKNVTQTVTLYIRVKKKQPHDIALFLGFAARQKKMLFDWWPQYCTARLKIKGEVTKSYMMTMQFMTVAS